MVDGVFFISSAVKVKQLSVFNNSERFIQTLNTVKSIDKFCPNNVKYMFDASYREPEPELVKTLSDHGVNFMYCGENENVQRFSDRGLRSLSETISFMMMLDWFQKNRVLAKRVYKVSGRYCLNSNFIPFKKEWKDSFVFLPTVNSWMPKEHQETAGVDKIFELRLWHMDYSLLELFQSRLPKIFHDMMKYNIDVEHSYYKNLHMEKWTTINPIGLEGIIAPTGVVINE
jgi:hypothetical protein